MKLKKKSKIFLIIGIVLIVLIIAAFVLYRTTYRFPDKLRDLTDKSLSASKTQALVDEILSKEDA